MSKIREKIAVLSFPKIGLTFQEALAFISVLVFLGVTMYIIM